ncbi:MAG: hypothetical protein JJT78_04430 [Leptospira sp.]|nr:hypothetical protein [Leptospira sp.]
MIDTKELEINMQNRLEAILQAVEKEKMIHNYWKNTPLRNRKRKRKIA